MSPTVDATSPARPRAASIPAIAISETSETTGNARDESAPATRERSLGLSSATALVIGSIVGTGVFTMPAVMAQAGMSSLLVLGVISIGALLLGAVTCS